MRQALKIKCDLKHIKNGVITAHLLLTSAVLKISTAAWSSFIMHIKDQALNRRMTK
ncbi:hypothetical protein HMPREF0454_04355 [Hafnia alvei ATCC 51873]|uniref:Uncharacterized protein n=1 Tax=Hafnia alvei ATCC 51873 TaxID=1002364 RepID=G9YCL7_HAFAL|nr:hypothetical protein HMPREF0454_04355 [Hafnia alvei ATCC 51873]